MQEECQLQVRKEPVPQRNKAQPEAPQREMDLHKNQPMAKLQESAEI